MQLRPSAVQSSLCVTTASRGCTFFLDQPQTLQTPYSHRNRTQRQKKETGKKSSRLFLALEIELPLELTGPEAAAGAWGFHPSAPEILDRLSPPRVQNSHLSHFSTVSCPGMSAPLAFHHLGCRPQEGAREAARRVHKQDPRTKMRQTKVQLPRTISNPYPPRARKGRRRHPRGDWGRGFKQAVVIVEENRLLYPNHPYPLTPTQLSPSLKPAKTSTGAV